jgi:urease accessory protein
MITLLNAPVGNLGRFPLGERTIERIELESDALSKRILRLSTSVGDFGLRLEGEARLRDGDIVFADEERVIAVRVRADDVLVAAPRTIAEALRLAHALGNRHLPIQLDGDLVIARFDPLVAELCAEQGVAARREERVLDEPFRHARAPHRHDE